jgi:hypothetical protein
MGAGESAPVQLELREGTRLDPVLAQHIVTCFKENNEKGKPLTPKRFEDVMEQVRILYGSQVATHDYEYLYNLFDLNHDGKGTASEPFPNDALCPDNAHLLICLRSGAGGAVVWLCRVVIRHTGGEGPVCVPSGLLVMLCLRLIVWLCVQ